MGIPIELPSSPAPRSGPCHSAKPSWSSSSQHQQQQQQQQHPSSSFSSSSSSSSSISPLTSPSSYSNIFPVVPQALSLARQQLLQDTRPPLTSLAYNPPPPHHHLPLQQSNQQSQRTLSPPSPSPVYGSYSDGMDQTTWMQQVRADVAAASMTAETEIQSPSPTRARPHPNLRRISRVPVFLTSPSGSGGSGTASPVTAMNVHSMQPSSAVSISTMTFDINNNSGTMSTDPTTMAMPHMDSVWSNSPPPVSQQRPIWHPSSPSLVHYLTRPLPPLPRPATTTSAHASPTPLSGGDGVAGEPYAQLQAYRQEQQHQQQYQQQQAQPLPQERASWNYRFVNMNHADNHNRPETTTMGGGGAGTGMHGYYYEDDRLRHEHSPNMRPYQQQQHQQQQTYHHPESTGAITAMATMTGMAGTTTSAIANVTAFSSSRTRPYYAMRGGVSEGTEIDDMDDEAWAIQQQHQQQQQLLSERRFRHRPSITTRERDLLRERERHREQQHHHHHYSHHGHGHGQGHNGQLTLSPTTLTTSSSSSSTPSSLLSPHGQNSTTSMTPIPSFLQGHPTVARTLIRADAFQQGVIHIYPENHAPIRMFGRPILTPASPSSPLAGTHSLSPSPQSSTSLDSLSSSVDNVDSIEPTDQGYERMTVHIPARPLATPPSSASIASTSSSILLAPIPSLPPPAVTTMTTTTTNTTTHSSPGLVSQEISDTDESSSLVTTTTITTTIPPILTRLPSAALLSPVSTSGGELYRFSATTSSNLSSPASASAYSSLGSPQMQTQFPSFSTFLHPLPSIATTMQAPRSQRRTEEEEEDDDAGKEGFEELSATETPHHAEDPLPK